MTCPRCGAKTRSKKTACPTCGHRPRRLKWIAIPIVIALIAFISVLTNAYLKEVPRSTDSLADKVDLNLTEETASADSASVIDFKTLQDSLYTVGVGTGFLISPQDVLTASRNVAGVTRVTLKHGKETVNGTVVGRTSEIAVIRIEKVTATPFSFSHAIAGTDESLLTLTPTDRIDSTVTFEETSYRRDFDLPNSAIGSPLVTTNGRVLGINLAAKTLPVALFERDVSTFLESETPAPPATRPAPATQETELAPIAPITPPPKQDEAAVESAPAPERESETDTTLEPAPEQEEDVAETTTEVVDPVEETTPVEPEEPVEETETPPTQDTETPTEPEPPVTEPTEPESPVTESDKPASLSKQDNKPSKKKKVIQDETPVEADAAEPVQEEAITEQSAEQKNASSD